MITVVFVCTGNTCRSPMAQVLLQDLLAESGYEFRILSAGTHADDGDAAAQAAIEVMSQSGLGLEGHRSTRLSHHLVERADVLLTMTGGHREFIVQRYPEAVAKTFTLKQFVGQDGDVHDPFGSDGAAYARTAAELAGLLEMAAQNLVQQARERKL